VIVSFLAPNQIVMNVFFSKGTMVSCFLLFAVLSAASAQQALNSLESGMVVWVSLDNGEAVNAMNELAASVSNASTTEDRFGIPQGAMAFGNATAVEFSSEAAGLNVGWDEWTVAVWFKSTDNAELNQTLWNTAPHNGAGVGYNYHIAETRDGLNVGLNSDPGQSSWDLLFPGPSERKFSDSEAQEWHHVALSKVGGDYKLFIDGALDSQWALEDAAVDYLCGLHLGKISCCSGEHLHGALDDFGVWNRALTLDEVSALANDGVLGCTDPAACNYNPGATVDDGNCQLFDLQSSQSFVVCDTSYQIGLPSGPWEASWEAFEGEDTLQITSNLELGLELSYANPAIGFNGDGGIQFANNEEMVFSDQSFVIEVAAKCDDPGVVPQQMIIQNGTCGCGPVQERGYRIDFREGKIRAIVRGDSDEGYYLYSELDIEPSKWYNIVLVVNREDQMMSLFVDGALEDQTDLTGLGNMSNPATVELGRHRWYDTGNLGEYLSGGISNLAIYHNSVTVDGGLASTCFGQNDFGTPVGMWDFASTEATDLIGSNHGAVISGFAEEGQACGPCVQSLTYDVTLVFEGCNDASACNFNGADLCDVDCVYPVVGGDCMGGEGLCGEGTYWDAASQSCLVTVPGDFDFDGCMKLDDLLGLLSGYNLCFDVSDIAFGCGVNDVSFYGYDYTTVQIGDQCWFAENLRTTKYANGDSIPVVLSTDEWVSNQGPAVTFREDSAQTALWGAYYNWESVAQESSICPSGWHVPSHLDWSELEIALGMDPEVANDLGQRGGNLVPNALSLYGDNTSGFSAYVAGFRFEHGAWDSNYSAFWTSDETIDPIPPSADHAISRKMFYTQSLPAVFDLKAWAMNVRCLKD